MIALCVASGPSLSLEQVEAATLSRAKIVAVNDVGLPSRLPVAIPSCDVWYAGDDTFWRHYEKEAKSSAALRVCASPHGPRGPWDIRITASPLEEFQFEDPGNVVSGGHSGFQALQIAICLGARRVVLLGYDCKASGSNTKFFGQKPAALHRSSQYKRWPLFYQHLRRVLPKGVEVLNATPGSAITSFPYLPLTECLC